MLTRFWGDQPVIGLDIGSSFVKAAVSRRFRDGSYELVDCDIEELPSDSIVGGQVMRTTEVAEAISRLMHRMGIHRGRPVAIASPPDANTMVRREEMPIMNAKELEEEVYHQVVRQRGIFPTTAEEVPYYDYFNTGRITAEQKMEIIFLGVRREMLNDYLSAVRSAGLVPVIVETPGVSLANLLEFSAHGEVKIGLDVVVSVGATNCAMDVFMDGLPIASHASNQAGVFFTERISEKLGVAREAAEQIKRDLVLSEPDEEIDTVNRETAQIFVGPVMRAIDYYSGREAMYGQIRRILLTGGGSIGTYIQDVLMVRMNDLVIDKLDPFRGFQMKDEVRAKVSRLSSFVAVALGLSLRRENDNLRP